MKAILQRNLPVLLLFSTIILQQGLGQIIKLSKKPGVTLGGIGGAGKEKSKSKKVVETVEIPKPLQDLKKLSIQIDDGDDHADNKEHSFKKRTMHFTNTLHNHHRNSYFYGEDKDGSILNILEKEQDGKKVYIGSITDNQKKESTLILQDEDGNPFTKTTKFRDFPSESELHHHLKPEFMKQKEKRHLFRNRGNSIIRIGDDEEVEEDEYADDGSVIDIMVLWSRNAECALNDKGRYCRLNRRTKDNMRAYIELAVDELNSACELSGVTTSFRLVRSYRESNYDEGAKKDGSSTYVRTLDELYIDDDGEMDDVHYYRSQYRADVVVMLIDQTGLCGYALKGPHPKLMFSVVQWECAVGNMSFGHEIGHNFGLNHDVGGNNDCDTEHYNNGYRDPEGEFRTIMAIDCEDPTECDANPHYDCPKILRFSTQSQRHKYHNKLVGNKQANNVRVINSVAYEVANYYRSTGPPPTQAPTPPQSCDNDADCDDNDDCSHDTCENGSCVYDQSCGICNKIEVKVNIQTDHYPSETVFEITNRQKEVLMNAGPFKREGYYSTVKCLPRGSYHFEIRDLEGDGMCCDYGEGSYRLAVNNKTVKSGKDFKEIDETDFDV